MFEFGVGGWEWGFIVVLRAYLKDSKFYSKIPEKYFSYER